MDSDQELMGSFDGGSVDGPGGCTAVESVGTASSLMVAACTCISWDDSMSFVRVCSRLCFLYYKNPSNLPCNGKLSLLSQFQNLRFHSQGEAT